MSSRIVPCPRCHFGNQPSARTCVYCLDPLPFTLGTARHSRPEVMDDPVDALADAAPPPSPSSRLDMVVDEGADIVSWLYCPPLPPVPLGPRSIVSLGRGPDCDLVLPHTEVSRHHAAIKVRGRTVQIEDEGSSNGTLINGRRVTSGVLKIGDSVKIGPYVLDVIKEPPERNEQIDHSTGATALVLSGNLEEVSVAEVLQNVEFNKWTGILQIARPGGRGEVEVVAGRPVRAFHDTLRGREAILSLVTVSDGNFSFARAPVAAGGEQINITALLLEATRVLDEGEKPPWVSEGSAASMVSDPDLDSHPPKSLADSSEIAAISAYMTADSASQSGEVEPPAAPRAKRRAASPAKRQKAPPLPPAGPHGTITARMELTDVEAVSAPAPFRETADAETQIAPLLSIEPVLAVDETQPVESVETKTSQRPELAPAPRSSRWAGVALFLVSPLLIVIPMATWSHENALVEKLLQERVRGIGRAIEQCRADPLPVRGDSDRLQELRTRLDVLRNKDADLTRASQRLWALEGLTHLANDQFAKAEDVLARPELQNDTAPAAALRGALASVRGDGAEAVPALTLAIEAGWRRTELYEWRATATVMNDGAEARRVLADLSAVVAGRGRLNPAQKELRVRALLAQGFVPAAAEMLKEIVRPDVQLRWAVALGQIDAMLKDGAFREAHTLLQTFEGPPPEALAAPVRTRLEEILQRDAWTVDPQATSDEKLRTLIDLWYVELRLRTQPINTWVSEDERTLDGLLRCMQNGPRPFELFLSASELVAYEGLQHRRELLAILYAQLEERRRKPRFKEQLVVCSILNGSTTGDNQVGVLYTNLGDATFRAELFLARGRARERLGKLRSAIRDLIRAKKINPELDVVDSLGRMRTELRRGG